ncbi:MAG: TRAP transporter small permease subunit [Gammaproteobacteria bacterium]|nr:TRAP transporter small permease subunit [Gammaproteobacteria bacterium]MDH3447986.1 TRAP transporter small permease subunit [Gammaproteobacteria bacterium]
MNTKGDSDKELQNTAEDLGAQIEEVGRRQELADPDAGLGIVDRSINRIVEAIGILAMLAIVATIFVNAIGRYAFDAHLLWAEELVLLLLPWLAMTGTFLAVRRGTMIRIDFFFERLPARVRRPLALAGYVLCVAMLCFLGVVSVQFVQLFGADTSPYLDISTGWSTAALAIGGFAAAGAFLALLLREFVAALRGDSN